MSDLIHIVGERFSNKPAFTLRLNASHDELRALLRLASRGRYRVFEISKDEFFIHIEDRPTERKP